MPTEPNRRTFVKQGLATASACFGVRGLSTGLIGTSILGASGCVNSAGPLEGDDKLVNVWGKRGLSDGRLQKPRAMTIDQDDLLYIVDMTGRIQVFDTDGNLQRFWRTPSIVSGKPTGMGINNEQQIMVADTHFFQVLFYTREGELLTEKTIGGVNGQGPGEFGFVTDAVQDSKGNYFVSEYGEFDRIQKFTPDGEFICQFGRHGEAPLEFNRPQNIVLDQDDNIWVADACNHRIQIIRCEEDKPELLGIWGEQGGEIGQLKYPYDLLLAPDNQLIVCEFGNHRVQRMSRDGEPIDSWGSAGRKLGQTYQPWAIVMDASGLLHVLDTNNHRMQTIRI